MNLSETYTETVQGLMGNVLQLPALFQTQPIDSAAILRALKKLDGNIYTIKKELILSLKWEGEALATLATADSSLHDCIADMMDDLVDSQRKHLIGRPGILLKLYLIQPIFPKKGIEHLLEVFLNEGDAYDEMVALQIPFGPILTDKLLDEAFSQVEYAIKFDSAKEYGYVEFIAYLQTFSSQPTALFLKKMEENDSDECTEFVDQCRALILHESKLQPELDLVTHQK